MYKPHVGTKRTWVDCGNVGILHTLDLIAYIDSIAIQDEANV